MLLNALFDWLFVEGRRKVTVGYDIAKQQAEEERERVERVRRQELMRLKIKSLFLAEDTLSLWASAASATWPRITGSHFTACTLVALLPCLLYLLFLCPSSCSSFTLSSFGTLLFESKVSSAVVRRQPQAAATRQQAKQSRHASFGSQRQRHLPPNPPLCFFPLSLLPIVNWQ